MIQTIHVVGPVTKATARQLHNLGLSEWGIESVEKGYTVDINGWQVTRAPKVKTSENVPDVILTGLPREITREWAVKFEQAVTPCRFHPSSIALPVVLLANGTPWDVPVQHFTGPFAQWIGYNLQWATNVDDLEHKMDVANEHTLNCMFTADKVPAVRYNIHEIARSIQKTDRVDTVYELVEKVFLACMSLYTADEAHMAYYAVARDVKHLEDAALVA